MVSSNHVIAHLASLKIVANKNDPALVQNPSIDTRILDRRPNGLVAFWRGTYLWFFSGFHFEMILLLGKERFSQSGVFLMLFALKA